MSSTAVAERQRFKVVTYLNDLVRRSQPSEPAPVETIGPEPFAPTSSFVTPDDKVIECEAEHG